MARIRYLKPEFFIDDDIAQLNYAIRLFYQGLWCHADKEGRLEDRPAQLKVQIMPYDNINANEYLNKLCEKPFIQRYEIGGLKYIQILAWHKHQKPHHTEKESIIPPPLTIPPTTKEKDKEKDKATQSELEVKAPLNNGYSKVIEIPTPEQVTEYSKLIGFALDGKYFCDYYEARGWEYRKGQKMRSWKAAVRTWKINGGSNGTGKSGGGFNKGDNTAGTAGDKYKNAGIPS